MDKRDIAHLRLQNHALTNARFKAPEDVVSWLGAVQAQEYPDARWSLGRRCAGVDDAAVSRAMAEGRILRTHALRPTWHFLAPEDIRWVLELTGPRVSAMMTYYNRQLELDEKVFAETSAVTERALEGGKQLTRTELAEALTAAGIEARGQRLGHIVMDAELRGVLCSGAPRGKQQTYALLDEVAKPSKALARDEALVELSRRYFTSHGPATEKDFRWWSSLIAADTRRALDMLAPELRRFDADGRTYWYAGTLDVAPEPSPSVHLLQLYDEYIVAYTESRDVLNTDDLAGPILGRRPSYPNAVIIDGQVAGYWRRTETPKDVAVEVRLVRDITPTEHDAVGDAVERFGRFAGLPATWQIVE